MNRRYFLSTAAAGGVQLLAAKRAHASPSDQIRVALIGAGGRGGDHVRAIARIPGVELVTVCDPDETRMAEKAASYEKIAGKKPALQQDLRHIMDDKSIDAVTIATCNHWHALATIWACQAGKHVYVEKPVCHDFYEGSQMVAAARRYNRVVQGGTQARSSGRVRKGILALQEGIIGEVYMARCIHYQLRDSLGFKQPEQPPSTLNWDLWVGPGPMRPFNRNLVPYNWHWFWDFGNGELGNNGVHSLDVARWGLKKELPSRIYSTGGRFGYKDQGQTPNTQIATYSYDDGTEIVMEIRGRASNAEGGMNNGVIFYGSKGFMEVISGSSVRVFLEGKTSPEPDLGTIEGAPEDRHEDDRHFLNFFAAMRANNREMLHAEIHEIHLSTALCLLGNISYRLGKEVRFDSTRRGFRDDPKTEAMLKGVYRPPFTVPAVG
jgi:predicted dehydrogenase